MRQGELERAHFVAAEAVGALTRLVASDAERIERAAPGVERRFERLALGHGHTRSRSSSSE